MTAIATDRRYHAKKRDRQAQYTKAGADIGAPQPIKDPARKAEATNSLRRFCEIYFGQRFSKPWSKDHLEVLARMQDAICNGGLYVLCLSRGSGKTSLSLIASLWAVLTGRHQFVMLVAVSATRAVHLLESIKTELLCNDLLHEDFPEATHPIRKLENRANRAKGQHIGGESTYIGWKRDEIVLPVVAGSQCSGAILRVAGLTSGALRGALYCRPHDGAVVRPKLCLLDDPIADTHAHSPHQIDARLRLLHGAILGMAGPGETITAVACMTVIAKNDMADTLLDKKQSPLWTGTRFQLLYNWPTNMKLWADYNEQRSDEIRNGGDGSNATRFYGNHRTEMDEGAIVAWPERHNADELSALQNCMNLHYRDAASFAAEYQNAPLCEQHTTGQLKAPDILTRTNGHERNVVPIHAHVITAYVDIQQKALFYVIVAWGDGFTGAILDYGVWPEQHRAYYTLADLQKTMAHVTPGGLEASIHAGLTTLCDQLLSNVYQRDDGVELKIERLLIDAAWGRCTDTVYAWCRQSPHAAIVLPSHGRFSGASSRPWSEYQKRPGEKLGLHWLMPVAQGKRAVRHILIDSNWWKSFVFDRLTIPLGARGSLTLYGKQGQDHRLFADHMCSEFKVLTEGRGRQVDEWRIRPERNDNHFFDCVVGATAAASLQGITIMDEIIKAPVARARISLKAMQTARKMKG